MATPKRVTANRANAKRSTGPTTAAGKQTVRSNAVVHGLSTPSTTLVVLPSESVIEFEQLRERCRSRLQPEGDIEDALVVRIAETLWRLARIAHIEAGILGHYYQQEQLRRAEVEVERRRGAEQRLNMAGMQMLGAPENPQLRAAFAQALAAHEEILQNQGPDTVTLGHAFLGDARDTDALGKLSRYEATLSKHLHRLTQMLHDLQDGRLPPTEPPPGGGPQ